VTELEHSTSADKASRLLNSKFEVERDVVTMSYGSDSSFFRGLEHLIGPPKPRLAEAMVRTPSP
jgi:hypothetical protein